MSSRKLLPTLGAAFLILGVAAFAQDVSGPKASEAKPTKATFLLTGLHCPPCTRTVESSLQGVKGVLKIKVDWETKVAAIEFDEAVLSAQKVSQLIAATPHLMGSSLHYGGWLALRAPEIKDEASGKLAEDSLTAVEGVESAKAYSAQHVVAVNFAAKGNLSTRALIDSLEQKGIHAKAY
jgi:copper chaperone CopZ